MYYKDEARSFNFLSGLLCGSVLGAGLALLMGTQKGVRPLTSRFKVKQATGTWRPMVRAVRRKTR